MRRLALVLALAAAAGCSDDTERHDHSDDHPEGHDHHADGHGHGDEPTVSFTLWSERFEIFAEHPPAVAGSQVWFLVHVTALDEFRPLTSGTLRLELDGPAPLAAESAEPIRPGIFRITATPKKPGRYRGALQISGDVAGEVTGIELEVFADPRAAARSVPADDDAGLIEFLKEQQWRVPFATAFARTGVVVASVEIAGRISTPPGGVAEVGAPVTGRIVAPRGGLLRPGTRVKKGQLLATLAPTPSSPEAAAQASLTVAEAEARRAAASAALERAERLIRDEAISARELEDARREAKVAGEAVRAARRAAALYAGASGAGGRGSWRLTAPIAGTLDAVEATPGATVKPGDTLFRIVDASELWIVGRVPEQEAARLRTDRDASYRLAGVDAWQTIDVTGDDATGSIVSVGRTVDPVARTVDVIYSVGAGDPSMRVGALVQLSLPAGDEHRGVVVERSALVNQDGRDLVYVQVDGEHFAERQVKAGPRAGAWVAVLSGLEPGERVVTTGAHLVRLADRAASGPAHGHVH